MRGIFRFRIQVIAGFASVHGDIQLEIDFSGNRETVLLIRLRIPGYVVQNRPDGIRVIEITGYAAVAVCPISLFAFFNALIQLG